MLYLDKLIPDHFGLSRNLKSSKNKKLSFKVGVFVLVYVISRIFIRLNEFFLKQI